jgi:hypothetical protein
MSPKSLRLTTAISALLLGAAGLAAAALPAAADQAQNNTGQSTTTGTFVVEADIDNFGFDVTKMANYDEFLRKKDEFIKNYWATHPQPEATATAPSN